MQHLKGKRNQEWTGVYTYKEHNTASFIHEALSNSSHCYARGGDTMDKEDFSAIFWAPFVDSDHTIWRVYIPATWQSIWRIVECIDFLLTEFWKQSIPWAIDDLLRGVVKSEMREAKSCYRG